MKQTQIMLRYLREFIIAIFAYIMVVVASNSLLMTIPPQSVPQVLVAIAPVVPVLFIIRSILKVLKSTDELQQRIQLFAFSFAAIATGLLTFPYGFLEMLGYPHLNPIWFLPTMIIFWGFGLTYFSRTFE